MKIVLLRYLAVGLGGFVGATARYFIALLIGRLPFRFPLGTMVINVSGSLFLGWFLAFATSRQISDTTRLAIGVGFVGAYTTFSTYMYETSRLADEGAGLEAMMNLLLSLILGLLAIRLGIVLARHHWFAR